MRNSLFLGAAVIALAIPAAAAAQETTSSIRGNVTANGAPVAGATVTIVNVPSGTTTSTVSGADGSFSSTGLRVGGPFTVTVSAPGYPETRVTDIFTVTSLPYELPVELAAEGQTGGDIVVTASSIVGAGSKSLGPVTVLTAADIAKVASVNRDIRDLMRRDPFARLDYASGSGRAVSFAGQNARFNRFSVDGVPITDNFGLNPDGLPTRRSPVPLDAIGQFQTKVAPYDVREGNFQGGAINAILKSGTNEFHGTGFYSYSSNKLTGNETKAGPGVPTGRVNLPKFKIENFGAELSGPIIKDKLFFMVAGERIRAGTPIVEGTVENNAGTVIPNVGDTGGLLTNATVNQITSIAQSRYNYNAGGVLNNSQDSDDRLTARLDANLSDTQRASLTYLYTKDSIRYNQNASVTAPSLGLESNGYIGSNRLHTGVFQLNSDWSDDFSTEFRAFYKDYKRGQDPVLGRGFAQFQVCSAPTSDRSNPGSAGANASTTCAPGYASVYLGPDVSRQSNSLTSRTYGGLLQGRLNRDNHDLRIFADFQDTKIENVFLQRTAGDYYFDSIADFQAGNAQRLRYGNAVPSLNPVDAAARFRYQSYAFGIQDNWRITDWFSLDYGIRYDMYGGHSRPAFNQAFFNRLGYANTAYISGRGIAQPRIGFDLRPTKDLSIRGGVGIFSGGSPDVYVSNSFSNTGFLSNAIDIRQNNDGSYSGTGLPAGVGAAALTNVNGTQIPGVVNNYLNAGTISATSPTNALSPNFKLPSQWRSTLSFDYAPDALPGFNFGADFFYSKVRNQVFFTDARVVPTALRTPDGRVRYASLTSFTDTNSDLILTNTTRGRSYIAVARVDKTFDLGLNLGASFTYQDIKDQAPATSSTASSNYGNGAFLDPNGAAYGISNEQVKYNIKYNLTFERAFFGDYKTTFALFGETRIGRPYSWTMQDASNQRSPVFGTIGSSSRYLLYVPTGLDDARVSYDSTATRDTFNALINATGLDKYRGQIAPRNAFNSKWFTKIDLHLAQEVPTGLGASRIQVFMDIENFANLLNKNWGQLRQYSFPYTQAAVRVQCLTAPVATGTAAGSAVATTSSQACAQYRYLAPNSTPTDTISSQESLYQIRIGARFSF
ncbi:carboxypeptidase regulatory-like domain-containing protein [Sphingomonas sanguinis]|uniref:Carboxypeptidase regulatory-like domain-containing protein n=1 Tax=Sphingomonas sanguinis TaxID=33051 RepID=A0ABU5LU64_9SPHN|nr:carboxypeptidase regulatory-like domain-containing protein [Sphingomonas sanguinis]MDZ7283479.1 carboxypeptidase regulatory-like domain-containing protein [Sphingomonas sanguinis]QXT37070.1 carboxypeptidase regulatory-like domain-containing protein [Sphingomonas sanguinis]